MGTPHVLHAGHPSVTRSTLTEATSDGAMLTSVGTVETAEQHLLGDVVFDCVTLDSSVLDRPAAVVDRIRACRPDVPVVAVVEDHERVARALEDFTDCTVVARTGTDWPAPLGRALEEVLADGAAETIGTTLDRDPSQRRQQLERYETIMETVGDGVYVLDGDGRFLAVNDAYVELTGYDREELLGTDAAEVVGVERTEQADDIQTALEAGGEMSTLRTTLPRKDGDTVPVEARISLFPLADGTCGRVGVVRDVRERVRLERELGEVLDRVSDAFFALDTDWQFTYVNDRAADLLGRDAEDLVGSVVWEAFPEATDTTFERQYRETVETGTATSFVAHYPPLEAWFQVHAYPSETGLSVYFTDVTESRRRRQHLADLTEAVQAFPEALRRVDVAETTVRAATEALDLPQATVATYDSDAGGLERITASGAGAEGLLDRAFASDSDGGSVAWDAYVEGELRTVEADEGVAVVVPLESHGVLVVAERGDVDLDTRLDPLSILGAHAKAALDRADREAKLREHAGAIEEKNESLERMNRLNSVLRHVTRSLTEAGTREELERSVCAELAGEDRYQMVWFSRYDSGVDRLHAVASEGIETDRIDPVALEAESVTAEAAATRAPALREDLHTASPPYEPWERAALRQGCQWCLAVPVQYGEERYGVLTLCATGGPIADLERTVLSEIGETVGFAINALDRKRALASERTVDLEFLTSPIDDPLFDLLASDGEGVELETLVQRRDGLVHGFFGVTDLGWDAVATAAEGSLLVESVTLVVERGEDLRFECTFAEDSPFAALLERGAMVTDLGFEAGRTRWVIRIPRSGDARRFVDLLSEHLETVELVARRERDEPLRSVRELQSAFEQRLTDRQRQVVESAYYSGFFEWPRESTGVEVAEMLDVSQPTVNRHIRRGERELFGMLFGDEDLD